MAEEFISPFSSFPSYGVYRVKEILGADGKQISSTQSEEKTLEESLSESRKSIFHAKQQKIIERIQDWLLLETNKEENSDSTVINELSYALAINIKSIQDAEDIYDS